MFSGSEGRKSVDSLSSLSSITHKADFPFHRYFAPPAILWSSPDLMPPIVRTGLQPHTSAPAHSTHKPPTARDIPPVTLTNIAHVESSEFAEYLTQVGALHEQLRRVKESEEEQASSGGTPRRNNSKDDLRDTLSDGYLRPGGKRPSRRLSVSSISSVTLAEAPSPSKRNPSNSRRGVQGPPPLSTIPNVYFDDDFHLENPRTFDIVSERSEVVPSAPTTGNERSGLNGNSTSIVAPVPRKALATNAILQEKLSWYMDTVELHLISSISTASTAFFTALGALKELHTEAAGSVDRIQALRKELGALDHDIATRGLEIVQQQHRRQNIQQFHAAVMQLKDIVDDVAACEALVDDNEVDKALDSIDALEMLIAGEQDPKKQQQRPYPLRDLRGATALQGVNDDITALRLRIGKAYEIKFVSVLLKDLRNHTETVPRPEVLMRWSTTDDLRAELLPILAGLYRAKHIAAASLVFRETVLREIKNLVRRPLPSSSDDDNESMMSSSTLSSSRRLSHAEKSSILARNLRALGPEDAEELLMRIYIGVAETLRRLTTQLKVLLDVASSVGDDILDPDAPLKSPPFSPSGRQMPPPMSDAGMEAQAELHRTLDMGNLLGQSIDAAQDKVIRVLRVRAEQSSHLSFQWFLRYFALNLHFANECEGISGRSGLALKTEVNGHVKDFVQYHGDSQMQKLAQGMDQDQWAARDFSEKDTKLLQQILDASTKDVEEWTEDVMIWTPYPTDDENDGETRRPLSLVQYLQLFNSRCTQLILGAGATRSAGLKNITTRHLAVASQSLAFIATVIPYVREFVRRRAGSSSSSNGSTAQNVMGEFDKVRRLYQEHQNSIYDKLVEIMGGRAQAHARTMRSIDWDASAPNSTTVHAYMDTLVKETTTLHRNLAKTLPEGTVRFIMTSVFAEYKEQLGGVLRGSDVKTAAGRDSMLHDVESLQTRLGKLDGFGDVGSFLKEIIESKKIKVPSPPPKLPAKEPEPKPVAASEVKEGKKEEPGEPRDPKELEEEKKEDGSQAKASSTRDGYLQPPSAPPKDVKTAVGMVATSDAAKAAEEPSADSTNGETNNNNNGDEVRQTSESMSEEQRKSEDK
ncbi:garp complex component [Grosmannia clavigera kw1407]|uniref:Garp complex component n=1 Tax=Grosmannia clavigera (strain kw1407 / UAMH 11150) TaxID=655863 RepID=F0XG78_GROCL|nr:garp complex component [Grosmannia clavigera kw1407]EFX02605.1 garp complex component [Grosmannia clavigera kw1407]